MIHAVIPLALFTLLSACGRSIPIQPDVPIAKVAADQPGGSLVGTWLRTESRFGGIYVDSLIITLRDGVADELNYYEKTIRLEGWDEPESICIETLDLGIDDYVACLMETAPRRRSLGSWGRIRIQSDNGRGHIHYDQWEEGREEEDGTRTLIQPYITYDNRLIVWDDQLILVVDDDLEDILEDIQLIRSTR